MSDFRSRRRFAQNFLVDPGAARRIVDAASIAAGEPVLEIGPGAGALTGLLLERAGRIAAVELDRGLAEALRGRFPPDRLAVLQGDVLRVAFAEVLAALEAPPASPLVVVSNLPYNVSKPVAMKMVGERASVARAVLMFQREVAARIVAREGSKDYGPLSVLCAFAFRVEPLFDVPPGAFRPRPKVVSTVTRWMPRDRGAAPSSLDAPLRACLSAAFARRRRTIAGNLRDALGDDGAVRSLLEGAGIDGLLRPEAVPAEAYLRLAGSWPGACGGP